jgi:hypothetical protein
MKHSNEEILALAKRVIMDLHGKYYDESLIRKVSFHADEELIRGQRIGEKQPLWTIVIDEPLFDSTDFLTMSDETGEPLYYQTKHLVAEIIKNADGYYTTVQ